MSQAIIVSGHRSSCGAPVRHSRPIALAANELIRHEALGAESVYRVVDVSDRLVSVEVVGAPGLKTGTRMRSTRRAAEAIQCEASQVRRGSHGRGRRSSRPLTCRYRVQRNLKARPGAARRRPVLSA